MRMREGASNGAERAAGTERRRPCVLNGLPGPFALLPALIIFLLASPAQGALGDVDTSFGGGDGNQLGSPESDIYGNPLAAFSSADDRSSSTANLRSTCVMAGTARPRILDGGPWLNHPGDRKTQTYAAEADYRPLPTECHGVFRRIPEIRFQIQNPTNHAQWINAGSYLSPMKSYKVLEEELAKVEQEREEQGKSCWRPIPGGEKNICRIDPHIKDDGGIGEAFFHGPPARLHKPRYSRSDLRVYRCTPGKGITHVRALFKDTVTNVKTRKVVGQRIAILPVRVRSYPGKGPMPRAIHGAVRGPC